MQDLHGGRKEQEVLSHLTRFADAQTRGFMDTAKKIEYLLPQLEALSNEVQEADKEYQYQRREREEKRRLLEVSNTPYKEPEQNSTTSNMPSGPATNGNAGNTSDSDLGRADSTGSQLNAGSVNVPSGVELSRSPGSLGQTGVGSPAAASKFKGIRDLEERDPQFAYGYSTDS